MSFTPLLALGTLVFTFVNFLTYVRHWNVNGIVTQLIAWASGVVAVAIAAHTQFASEISFGDKTLAKLDGWSQVFIGLIATSLLSTLNEFKKAIDCGDSAKKDPLIGPASTSAAGAPTK
jgi:hypothetical protein